MGPSERLRHTAEEEPRAGLSGGSVCILLNSAFFLNQSFSIDFYKSIIQLSTLKKKHCGSKTKCYRQTDHKVRSVRLELDINWITLLILDQSSH